MTDAPIERGGEGAWSKLRDRKVVQWGLGYAAAAWTLLQVIESLVETFSWPPAIRQLATIGLCLSLLIALVLAWYHGERGDQAISKSEAGILVALVALIGGALWWYGTRLDESAWSSEAAVAHVKHGVPSGAPSVAVLPFVNMSADP